MSSCKVSKVENHTEIKQGNAEKFYDVFLNKPHHIPGMMSSQTRAKLPSVELHDKDDHYSGVKVGSLVSWHFIQDGEAKVSKEKIGAIDRENKSVTWEAVEGDLLEHYKSFKFILHITSQNGDQASSVAHWVLEYEKVDDNVPEPHAMLQLVSAISKDLDAHLSKTT